jgi:glycosyltransferase involved in cell wall biosynthesis
MLRTWDEKGGIGVYTQNLLRELLSIDRNNEYILFYRNAANLGIFSHYSNVTELFIKGSNKALWDQMAIPLACFRERVDLVFHPKFTVPLLAPCKTVMVVHGADWFIPEHAKFYKPLDVRYIKAMMPLYFKKAAVVISVSEITTENFNRVLKLPPGKVKTVYFGPAKHFKRVEDEKTLRKVKDAYGLPEKFILTLSKYGGGGRKNIDNVIKAYKIYHENSRDPYKLVIAGKDCDGFKDDYDIPSNGYGRDILFPGWVQQESLPAFYSLAALYLYPSNLEAFPIPLTEAMACGTAIITSNVNGLKEIAGDGAIFVNPDNASEIAQAILRVVADTKLRKELSEKGLARSRRFNWTKCAKETLEILERQSNDTKQSQA